MDAASVECRITRGREGWGGQRSAFERNLDDRKQVLGLAGPTRADHLQTQRSSPSAQALDPEEAKEDASSSPDGQDPLPASSPGLGRAAGAQAGNSLPTQPRGALGNMSSGPPPSVNEPNQCPFVALAVHSCASSGLSPQTKAAAHRSQESLGVHAMAGRFLRQAPPLAAKATFPAAALFSKLLWR